MELSTSVMKNQIINYGLKITPENYLRAEYGQNTELLLYPGITYLLPLYGEDIIFTPAKRPEETGNERVSLDKLVESSRESNIFWLKLAESAFKFWDNKADEVWNNL